MSSCEGENDVASDDCTTEHERPAVQSSVIVWGFVAKHGIWLPYNPQVSNAFQTSYERLKASETGLTDDVIDIFQSTDKKELAAQVDFTKMLGYNASTDALTRLGKQAFSSSSCIGHGIRWQIDVDGVWMDYDPTSCNVLEEAKKLGKKSVDLSELPCNIAYTVDLMNMKQTRHIFLTERPIRRLEPDNVPYITTTEEPITVDAGSLKSTSISNTIAFKDVAQGCLNKVEDEELNDKCIICMGELRAKDEFDDVTSDKSTSKLSRCNHCFHYSCLEALYNSGTKQGHFRCPICKSDYGERRGTCPAGEMSWAVNHSVLLLGTNSAGAIFIMYNIDSGIQGPEHPNPGAPFSACNFPRQAILPLTDEGVKVLKLLQIAWRRRLTFTVGTSLTTGLSDTVTWNDIHHKTSLHGPFGYPDPNFISNVTAELRALGVEDHHIQTSE